MNVSKMYSYKYTLYHHNSMILNTHKLLLQFTILQTGLRLPNGLLYNVDFILSKIVTLKHTIMNLDYY